MGNPGEGAEVGARTKLIVTPTFAELSTRFAGGDLFLQSAWRTVGEPSADGGVQVHHSAVTANNFFNFQCYGTGHYAVEVPARTSPPEDAEDEPRRPPPQFRDPTGSGPSYAGGMGPSCTVRTPMSLAHAADSDPRITAELRHERAARGRCGRE